MSVRHPATAFNASLEVRQKQHLTTTWCGGVTGWRESIAVVVGAGLSLPTSQAAQFEQVPVRRRAAGEQLLTPATFQDVKR